MLQQDNNVLQLLVKNRNKLDKLRMRLHKIVYKSGYKGGTEIGLCRSMFRFTIWTSKLFLIENNALFLP